MNMMIRIILIALLISACNHEETTPLCNSEDPVASLDWLEDFIEEVERNPKYHMLTISAMEYQGQTIFNIYEIVQSCAYCDLRDCSGQKYTPSDFMDFITNKTNERKIWCQDPQWCSS